MRALSPPATAAPAAPAASPALAASAAPAHHATGAPRTRHASGATLAAALALAALLAGCSAGVQATTKSGTASIAAGDFVEFDYRMEAGATLTYSWSATAPLTFDIHSHDGGEVRVWANATGNGSSGTFTAPHDGTFSLMWQADGAAQLTYDVHGEARLLRSSED